MTDKQLMEQALEALERYVQEDEVAEGMPGNEPWVETKRMGENAITAIRARLEQPEQEPVAHWSDCAVHSEPAYPAGKCDCGGYTPKVHAHQELYKAAKDFYNLTVAEPALRLTSKNRSVRDAAQAAGERLRALITIPPAAQPAPVQEPVAWAGWHTSTDEMMLFKTKAEAVSWLDQYKKGFASIEGLVRPFLPAAQRPVAEPHKWVGLTGEELIEIADSSDCFEDVVILTCDKLKEKNGGAV